ncbi:hypothetical protein [Rossellomorea vietnamensis]|uniref:hypothetical protein n=1 Tax=Rossellomorea vietnamensis TaxID=218284 RepID=UPI001E5D419B|nr:hypothetical protein [Rossellomorea vietnamensis]
MERESQFHKDVETIEKLFSETEEGYRPTHVIGIQYIESKERIAFLNNLVLEKNSAQQSHVLMIYRFHNGNSGGQQIYAYWFKTDKTIEERRAFCKEDDFVYWFMGFAEEIYK